MSIDYDDESTKAESWLRGHKELHVSGNEDQMNVFLHGCCILCFWNPEGVFSAMRRWYMHKRNQGWCNFTFEEIREVVEGHIDLYYSSKCTSVSRKLRGQYV